VDPLFYERVGADLRAEDPMTRAQAIAQLERAGEVGAVRMALSHAKNETKKEILKLIGIMAQRSGGGQWVSLLRDQLCNSDTMEKCRLLYVMRYLEDAAISTLAAEQFGFDEMAVRKAALAVLDRLDKQQKLAIFSNLSLDPDPDKRLRAIRSLTAFKHPAIVPILKRGLKDTEYTIRMASYEALGKLKDAGIDEATAVLAKVPKPTTPPGGAAPSVGGASLVAGLSVITAPSELDDGDLGDDGGDGDKRLSPVERNLAEGKICRTCIHIKKERPDKKMMAPQRLWCNNLRKETLPTKTCMRGSWNT